MLRQRQRPLQWGFPARFVVVPCSVISTPGRGEPYDHVDLLNRPPLHGLSSEPTLPDERIGWLVINGSKR